MTTPQSIAQLKSQGPLPTPNPELYPGINPYQQQWLALELGQDSFEKLLQLPTADERKVELVNMTRERVENLKREQPVNVRELLGAMQRLGDRQRELGLKGEAEGTYLELLELYKSLPTGTTSRDALNRTYGLGHLNFCMGRYGESERLYREALPYVSQPPLGMDSPQYLGAWRAIIEAVARQGGRWDDVKELLEEGFELVRGMKGGEWEKFEEEEREAMEEVRETVEGLEREEGVGKVSEGASAKL